MKPECDGMGVRFFELLGLKKNRDVTKAFISGMSPGGEWRVIKAHWYLPFASELSAPCVLSQSDFQFSALMWE